MSTPEDSAEKIKKDSTIEGGLNQSPKQISRRNENGVFVSETTAGTFIDADKALSAKEGRRGVTVPDDVSFSARLLGGLSPELRGRIERSRQRGS